jgi:hypothetical protein
MYGLREKARLIELRQQNGPHKAGPSKYGAFILIALVIFCAVMIWIANR